MRRTALYDAHIQLGGRMVDFAGWELPVQYPTGPTKEHVAVRTAAGLFDIDHMGQFELTGPDATAFLERVQTAPVAGMDEFDARYSLMTYADGGVVDDIFLYKLTERWLIVVNASNRSKDMVWLQAQSHGYNVSLIDLSDSTYMLALQGPAAQLILQRLTEVDLGQLAVRRATQASVALIDTLIGRTGYTGEDGFELYFSANDALAMWDALLAAGEDEGLLPCGLGARDSLRFEACMPLYGHEITANTNPIEARLGWAIDYEHDFIGRSAILKAKLEGPQRILTGLEMVDKAVPRDGYPIEVAGEPVGYITSGMRSPSLEKYLAMAYLQSEYSALGQGVDVVIRGQSRLAKVVKRPFYRRSPN